MQSPLLLITQGGRHRTLTFFPFFALLYLALFAAFGTESPFFPSFLAGRGLSPGKIGAVLAAGTLVRLSTGPLLGIAADRYGRRRFLALTAIGSGTIILLYLAAAGFSTLLLISMAHAVMIAPLTPLADAPCVAAGTREKVFCYGSVRGLGSAGFMIGTMASGVLVAAYGLDRIIIATACEEHSEVTHCFGFWEGVSAAGAAPTVPGDDFELSPCWAATPPGSVATPPLEEFPMAPVAPGDVCFASPSLFMDCACAALDKTTRSASERITFFMYSSIRRCWRGCRRNRNGSTMFRSAAF